MNQRSATDRHSILIVDDSTADQRYLTTVLEDADYIVHAAGSGAVALRFVETKVPDLILMDLHMPGLDGLALCERLKANERTHDVPVIFVSGVDPVLGMVTAFAQGAVDYILKPFADEEVLARVRTHLSLRDLQRRLEDRVRERTDELEKAVEQLNAEVEARKQVEAELRRHRDHLDELVTQRTAALAAAKDVAETANKAKSTFLANMSHELRSPLNGILGYSQLLQLDKALSPSQMTGVQTIQKSGEHLLTLINDILDLAKMEAHKVVLDPADVHLPRFLRVIGDIIRVKAEHKNISFDCDLARDLPRAVRFDDKHLRQVLLNLLDNAVKFTDSGSVSFRVRFVRPSRLRFEIEDTGVGMTPEQVQTIFRPFEQVGDLQRRRGGTGLGLAISRELVRLMGSDIQVGSELGRGSQFWLELDVPIVEATLAEAAPQRAVTGYHGPRKRVLVADDIPDSRAVVVAFLNMLGFETFEAVNGQDCLEQARAAVPHAIVMDIHMPVMSGTEATRLLRQRAEFGPVPIIAMSASASGDNAASSFAAGANAFIPKPVSLSILQAHLGALLDLTWVYESPDGVAGATDTEDAPIVAPPADELKVLHQLARIGNMRSIQERAQYLITLDEKYRTFADRVSLLAGRFESKAIFDLIAQYLHAQ